MTDFSRAEEIILAHAQKPYDPVARRERYLRERELKGRATGAGSDPIPTRRPKAGKPTPKKKTAQEQALSAAQKRAQESMQRISDKLAEWAEMQAMKNAAKGKRISDAARAEIESLPEIPKWVLPATKARLQAARRAEIARILGNAKSDRDALGEETADKFKEQQKKAQVQREKVAKDLKTAIEKIRKSHSTKTKTAANGR